MSDTPDPKSFADVLRYELEAVRTRRAAVSPGTGPAKAPDADAGIEVLRGAALDDGMVGLALSGGGVRSATFGLGVLQGLSRLGLLTTVDYLSTVSGGGYVGGWLTAWVHREGERLRADGAAAAGATRNIEKQLDPDRKKEAEATRVVDVENPPRPRNPNTPLAELFPAPPGSTNPRPVLDDEPEPVYHLRAYSNYLAPRPGLLSGDLWTLFAIYTRNTLVNLLILVPAVLAVVFLAYVVVWWFAQPGGGTWSLVPAAVAAGLAVFALVEIGNSLTRTDGGATARESRQSRQRFYWLIIGPTVVQVVLATWMLSIDPATAGRPQAETATAVLGAAAATWAPPELRYPDGLKVDNWLGGLGVPWCVKFALTIGLVGAVAGLLGAGRRLKEGNGGAWAAFWSPVVLGLVFGILCGAMLAVTVWPLAAYPTVVATVGPPLFLAALAVAGFVESAVHSKRLTEHDREWRSRLAATLVFVGLVWLAFFGIVFLLPAGVRYLSGMIGLKQADVWAVVGWVATTGAGLFAANSSRTGGDGVRKPNRLLGLIAAVAPVVFLVGLLGLLGVLAGMLVGVEFDEWKLYAWGAGAGGNEFVILLAAAGVGLLSAVLLSAATDVNVFSMHALYANRLIRGYLGASRRKVHATDDRVNGGRLRRNERGAWEWGPGLGGAPTGVGGPVRREHPITGFDGGDDVPLGDLRFEPGAPDGLRHTGPYHLIGTALNLVAGDELAVQDRRASSFVLSPGFCGSDETGYAETPVPTTYHDPRTLTLGRAMTISGAAADPNMATHNSAAVTALMTVFNVRLGWWMENPRFPRGTAPPAAAGVRPRRPWTAYPPAGGMLASLFRELLGLTHARGEYVHLTDGGHYDNTGVYELVRRRCRFVIQVDAGADPGDLFEDVGQLVRRVRADFGVRIEIDPTPVRRAADGTSKWHVAVGRIRYDDVDANALPGTLVYVRPTRTGDEPADVRQYADAHPDYPHTTTADQFFDNDQFEAYRAIGEHVALSVFGDATRVARNWPPKPNATADEYRRAVRALFAEVHGRWYPPPAGIEAGFQTAGQDCATLMSEFRKDKRLAGFVRDMYPELPPAAPPAGDSAAAPDRTEDVELLATNQLLDVMERAWHGIRLATHYDHPINRGWMNAFRRWSSSDAFRRAWPVIRGEYGKDFVRFCERSLNLPAVRAVPELIDATAHAARVAMLDGEFALEWGSRLGRVKEKRSAPDAAPPPATVPTPFFEEHAGEGGNLLAQVVEQVRRTDSTAFARAWLLYLSELRPDGQDRPIERLLDHPVGLVAVVPRLAAGGVRHYEVLFWVRPAYRSLGLGRSGVEHTAPDGTRGQLYVWIRDELRRLHGTEKIRLWAHYPAGTNTRGERPQRDMWLNFCHDYDFRRHDLPNAGAGAEPLWVSVKFDVQPESTPRAANSTSTAATPSATDSAAMSSVSSGAVGGS